MMEDEKLLSSSSIRSQNRYSHSATISSSSNFDSSFDIETTNESRILPLSNVINRTSNDVAENLHIPRPFIPTYLRNTLIDMNNRVSKESIQLPSGWNKYDAGDDIRVKECGLGAEVVSDNHEAAAIRTDYPIPVISGIYYFEIDIIFGGKTK
ncbi:2769_t:CDS:2 [Acaulospora colombiana]|uniref:2769_t:CDS:1 n=1 Tax=Acaulospora colombiana TaxID=27376 RepID=A0ACA9JYN6_9GLOM|nr:2769_t:CDS:2 [Acaulospora colombiana]